MKLKLDARVILHSNRLVGDGIPCFCCDDPCGYLSTELSSLLQNYVAAANGWKPMRRGARRMHEVLEEVLGSIHRTALSFPGSRPWVFGSSRTFLALRYLLPTVGGGYAESGRSSPPVFAFRLVSWAFLSIQFWGKLDISRMMVYWYASSRKVIGGSIPSHWIYSSTFNIFP